jgi:mono/diheme cytochrome c family protein
MRATFSGVLPLLAVALVACGGGKTDSSAAATTTSGSGAAPAAGLTAFQLKQGIGPVTEEVSLGALDQALVEEGSAIFTEKCSACHKEAERYVGPPLGGVTERRSPAYVMNMILNPQEMYEKHPDAHKLLAEYMTQMPYQTVSREQARAILEYLRTLQAPSPAS